MPEILEWHGEASTDALPRVVRTLAAGGLVALPTESTYEVAAAALNARAVERLAQLVGTTDPPAIALSASAEAADWLPFLSSPAARLMRKLGPGPYKLRADGGPDYGLLNR